MQEIIKNYLDCINVDFHSPHFKLNFYSISHCVKDLTVYFQFKRGFLALNNDFNHHHAIQHTLFKRVSNSAITMIMLETFRCLEMLRCQNAFHFLTFAELGDEYLTRARW
jgi:hypothetical protein